MDQAEVLSWVKEAEKAFTAATDLDSLKEARLAHLGDKSPIAQASRALGSLPAEEKASAGKIIGEGKAAIAAALEQATAKLESEQNERVLRDEVVDITLPVSRAHKGGLHPITIIKNEISDFFIEQGFSVAEGPELESGWLNFDALNIPADHPARTMQDTFFIEPIESGVVLRTHTSPVQMNSMQLIALFSIKLKVSSLIKESRWLISKGLLITLPVTCSAPMSPLAFVHHSSRSPSQVLK